ncbi:polysaccharide deacetylase family protein [Bdellovibrio sp. HCB290]|uniref:polysaccharide deacetylase family protein n=1 Tax=Bdellovibrio sp. HCB290 TaxID=3394356 RepID=UPI0039B4E0BB
MIKFICAVLILSISVASAKEVALTIDDAPLSGGLIYSGPKRTSRFIDVLKKEKIQAAFFCNPSRLNQDDGAARLTRYANAGHIIANHTFSHPSLNQVTASEYAKEIERAESILSSYSTFKKWFRFPFLHEGRTIEKRDAIRKHLDDSGYINGYVTTDNYDYVINDFVQKAMKKKLKVDLDRACDMLSDLNLFGLEEQERLAKKHLGTSVTQVLLMHENDIEAFCLDKSIAKLRSNGWKIVSPERAYSDPTLKAAPNTLWLDQGRLAAIIAATDGTMYKSKWENINELQRELIKRKIAPTDATP